jgi:hypothetical protein
LMAFLWLGLIYKNYHHHHNKKWIRMKIYLISGIILDTIWYCMYVCNDPFYACFW